jgi:hypothetical protein
MKVKIMKSPFFSLTLFGILTLSGFNTDISKNFFTIGDKKISLNSAIIANESYGVKSKFEVDLISQSTDLTKAQNYVYFSLTTNNTTNLTNGIYEFSSAILSQRLPFNFNGTVKVNGHVVEIADGTISIENRKGDFDIQFVLKLKNGDTAKGAYQGKVSEVNRSRSYE